MFFKKEDKSADDFWQEYEEKINEKVLERGLGMYIRGWDEFDAKGLKGIWGLIITTSGGFRFHHFPKHSWLDNLASFGSSKQAKEKTFFIPQEKIISSELQKETKWWKKIFSSTSPSFVIKYTGEAGEECKLIFETLSYTKQI